MDKQHLNFQTRLVHGYDGDPQTGATAVPIYQTTSFAHDTAQEISDIFNNRKAGYTYSRIANPTVVALENNVACLENGLGSVAVSTGMAASAIAIQALVKSGDNIVTGNSLFGGTYYMMQEFVSEHGITVTFVESTDVAAYEAAITDKTKLLFCETIGNPKVDVPNIKAIADVAKRHDIPFLVDSTTATPYLINLKELGVSVSILSATKWLGGQGTTVGGIITDLGNVKWGESKSEKIVEVSKKMGGFAYIARCKKLRSNMGAALGPMDAFMLMSGIETLALRFERQCQNALQVAEYLESHPDVVSVNYPGLVSHPQHEVAKAQFKGGFGGIMCFQLTSKEACFNFIDRLKLIKNLANLGDNKTLAIHPDSTIYRDLTREEKDAAGAFENLIRISVGIEFSGDIIADIEQAIG